MFTLVLYFKKPLFKVLKDIYTVQCPNTTWDWCICMLLNCLSLSFCLTYIHIYICSHTYFYIYGHTLTYFRKFHWQVHFFLGFGVTQQSYKNTLAGVHILSRSVSTIVSFPNFRNCVSFVNLFPFFFFYIYCEMEKCYFSFPGKNRK